MEIVHQLYILHLKHFYKISLAVTNELLIPCQYQIIKIQHKNERMPLNHNIVQVRVNFTLGEAQSYKVVVSLGISFPRCLLEPIKRYPHLANMCGFVEILKSLKLLNIYLFLNNFIKEGCHHIHLVDPPPHLHSNLCYQKRETGNGRRNENDMRNRVCRFRV